MTRLVAILLVSLSAATFAQGEEKQPEHVRRLLEGYRQGVARINGVQLKITVDGHTATDLLSPVGTTSMVDVHWTIDYDGPRPPLNILKPTLGPSGSGQTYVLFFLIATDGKDYPVTIRAESPNIPGIYLSGREDFLTLKPKAIGRGTITVSWARVLVAAREKWPKQLGKDLPTAVYVQLRHQPTDRAEHLGLDAWTGHQQTELVPVPRKYLELK